MAAADIQHGPELLLRPDPAHRVVGVGEDKELHAVFSDVPLEARCIQSIIAVFTDKIALDEFKTKKIAAMLKAVEAEKKPLIVLDTADQKVIKSAANIPGAKTTQVNTLNVYDILNAEKLVIVKDAVSKIEEVYA